MNFHEMLRYVNYLAFCIICLTGCGGVSTAPTDAITPASTTILTSTPAPTATLPSTPAPTATPTPQLVPSIIGKVSAWGEGPPIANRRLLLCQIPGNASINIKFPVSCRLMGSASMTDAEGEFVFYNTPQGTYLILYDSGLMDFDAGMNHWEGKNFQLGDINWLLNEYLDIKYGIAECYLPTTLPMSMYMDAAAFNDRSQLVSWSVHYLHCNSPFILAQKQARGDIIGGGGPGVLSEKLDVTIDELENSSTDILPDVWKNPVVVEVTKDKLSEVSIDVMYFGDEKPEGESSRPTATPTVTPTLPVVISE